MVKERKSGIELMRIICILMVIGGHYYCHSEWNNHLSTFNESFLRIFGGCSKLAVNCFVIITGYFGANIKTKRVISLIRDRWFYSLFITAVLLLFGISDIGAKLLINTLFPLLTCRHNYITVFVMLYFFIPFLNSFFDKLNDMQVRNFMIVSTLFLSVMPSAYPSFSNNTYAYILWMMYLFFVGRCIQKYGNKVKWNIWLPILFIILFAAIFIVEPIVGYSKNYAINMQYSFLLLLASVSFVGFFANLNIPYNKIINGLSRSTFAVYILHDDPNVRNYIWKNVFRTHEYADKSNLWMNFIFSVFAIYFVCIIIDKIYRISIDKLLKRIPVNKVESLFDKIYEGF